MATAVVFEERIVVPMDIRSLADFRRWALSPEFPELGRIDYLGGIIEVDMSPEEIIAHFGAGVREYWLADARREPFVFRIHRRGAKGFKAVAPDADGFQFSGVVSRLFRLDWRRDRSGYWAFDLQHKPKPA